MYRRACPVVHLLTLAFNLPSSKLMSREVRVVWVSSNVYSRTEDKLAHYIPYLCGFIGQLIPVVCPSGVFIHHCCPGFHRQVWALWNDRLMARCSVVHARGLGLSYLLSMFEKSMSEYIHPLYHTGQHTQATLNFASLPPPFLSADRCADRWTCFPRTQTTSTPVCRQTSPQLLGLLFTASAAMPLCDKKLIAAIREYARKKSCEATEAATTEFQSSPWTLHM